MFNITKLLKYLTPIQILVLGYLIIILLGSLLLLFPFSTTSGYSIKIIDAIFTATSAVSTTGLSVIDIGSNFSLFGQLVILFLIQIGGLGYMIFYALTVLTISQKLSLSNWVLLKESIPRITRMQLITFIKIILIFTLIIQLVGSVLLTFYWINTLPVPQAIYTAIFHSVSAFCTAGFSLFSDNLSAGRYHLPFNLIIWVICILGSLGFFVLYDIFLFFKNMILQNYPNKLTVHSKLVLVMTLICIGSGALILWISEYPTSTESFYRLGLTSIFQSVSASTTTGFNTINISAMNMTGLFFIIILMFIGSSPGGTGGGVKTTSIGILSLYVMSHLRNQKEVNLYYHSIPMDIIKKTIVLISLACGWIAFSTILLTWTENQDFLKILFEIVSAFGTVGLSTGITSELSDIGKFFISFTMLIGRVGTLAIGYSLLGRKIKSKTYQYAQTDILVG